MKKIFVFFVLVFLVCGCGKAKEENLVKNLKEKISSEKSYQLTAKLEIYRNEEKFTYDVISSYKKGDYFKVDLINQSNNHEQIILKDKESVYVLTPSLNKSFKFQSEWPYNNSQIYLLQPILKDIESDENKLLEETKEGFIITSKVNYANEKDFFLQKVYFDINKNIFKVEVLDEDYNIKMCLNIINIKYGMDFDKDYFNINKYIVNGTLSENPNETSLTTSSIGEILYPMYVPVDTYLTNQDVIQTESGERVILTFSGKSNFVFVQENLSKKESSNYVYGDPYLIVDNIGSITDSSVSWINDGIEYSVISDTVPIDELLVVAQSVALEMVGK